MSQQSSRAGAGRCQTAGWLLDLTGRPAGQNDRLDDIICPPRGRESLREVSKDTKATSAVCLPCVDDPAIDGSARHVTSRHRTAPAAESGSAVLRECQRRGTSKKRAGRSTAEQPERRTRVNETSPAASLLVEQCDEGANTVRDLYVRNFVITLYSR